MKLNKRCADGAGADGNFIMVRADTKVDRRCFIFSVFIRNMSYVRVLFCLRIRS